MRIIAKKSIGYLLVFLVVSSLAVNVFAFSYLKKLYINSLNAKIYPVPGLFIKPKHQGSSKGKKVLFVGDSRVFQWHPMPAFADMSIINAGYSGETSGQLRLRYTELVSSVRPAVVIIQTGINDLKILGLQPERKDEMEALVYDNISNMVTNLTEAGKKVILLTVFPAGKPDLLHRFVWSSAINKAVKRVNIRLLSMVQPNLTVIDSSKLLAADNMLSQQFQKDTLHINQRGYLRLNEKLASVISEKI